MEDRHRFFEGKGFMRLKRGGTKDLSKEKRYSRRKKSVDSGGALLLTFQGEREETYIGGRDGSCEKGTAIMKKGVLMC